MTDKKVVLDVDRAYVNRKDKNPGLSKAQHSKESGYCNSAFTDLGKRHNKLLAYLLDYHKVTGKPIEEIIKEI